MGAPARVCRFSHISNFYNIGIELVSLMIHLRFNSAIFPCPLKAATFLVNSSRKWISSTRALKISPIPTHIPIDTKYIGLSGEVFIKVAEEASPFVRDTLSCKVSHLVPGRMSMSMAYKPALIGNPVTRVLHGGVTAAIIDHVGGFCAMSSITDKNILLSTVDLRIDYINPAQPETMHCDAEVISTNKTLIRADIIAWNADRTKKIAIGRALYSMYQSKITINDAMEKKEF